MKKTNLLRKWHKWLALFTGFQLLIWSISGLYMTSIDIDIIHGDHLVSEFSLKSINVDGLVPISPKIFEGKSAVKSISLQRHFEQRVYKLVFAKESIIVDANTGKIKETLAQQTVLAQANEIYAGKANISTIDLLNRYPGEIGGKRLPVWRVTYDDWLKSTLYFHHQSGQLIKKRTRLWRVFDIFWKLHIMDFLGSKGPVGYLFRSFSIGVLLMSLFGLGLLYLRLQKEKSA